MVYVLILLQFLLDLTSFSNTILGQNVSILLLFNKQFDIDLPKTIIGKLLFSGYNDIKTTFFIEYLYFISIQVVSKFYLDFISYVSKFVEKKHHFVHKK